MGALEAEQVVGKLNSLIQDERWQQALSGLLLQLTPVDSELARSHPSQMHTPEETGRCHGALSPLGLLNLLLGPLESGDRAGWGRVTVVEEGGLITRFELTESR